MKRVIGMVLALWWIALLPLAVLAEDGPEELPDDNPLPAVATVENAAEIDLSAAGAILMEQNSGRVLLEKDSDAQRAMASVTKVMSLLLVMEALDSGRLTYDTMLTCSDTAAALGGSQIWLEPGEQMSVEDLLKAVFVVSANDATVLLGETLSGSEESFVADMNRRAGELGLTGTHFVNATGLDAPDHYTTAHDVAVIARELLAHPDVMRFSTVWMDTLRGGTSQLVNTNKLVRFYKGCTGLKTGTTSAAGSCLAASATRDGVSLIAVVLGAPSSKDRFADAQKLLNYGFAKYTRTALTPELPDDLTLPVEKGVQKTVGVVPSGEAAAVLLREEAAQLRQEYRMQEGMAAPFEAGAVVGNVRFYCGEICVGEVPLVTAEAVKRLDFWFAFRQIVACLFQL